MKRFTCVADVEVLPAMLVATSANVPIDVAGIVSATTAEVPSEDTETSWTAFGEESCGWNEKAVAPPSVVPVTVSVACAPARADLMLSFVIVGMG